MPTFGNKLNDRIHHIFPKLRQTRYILGLYGLNYIAEHLCKARDKIHLYKWKSI